MNAQREWFDTDYYAVLGVDRGADHRAITKAYRKLARELHPDQNPGDAAAEERFKQVAAAYDVLGDEKKRAEYDEVRRLGPNAGGFSFNAADMSGFGDLFGQMFGSGGRSRGSSGVGPRRGDDLEARLTLEFADAVRGVTTSLSLISDDRCSTCSGSGAAPGTGVRTCGVCGGRGVVDENQGPFSFSSPCRACGGRGSTIEKPCPTCSASGVEKRQRTVPVRIPPGVADGQTIRLKGKGTPGRNGGPAGDLLVEIAVRPHDRFGRKGDDLTVAVPVAFTDLVLGAEVAVPTLDGSTVRLRLRPGTPSGSRHRVAGRGVSRRRGGREVTGDLIATVNVVVPTELSDGERSAIEALAAATSVGGEGDVSSIPVDDAAPGGDEG